VGWGQAWRVVVALGVVAAVRQANVAAVVAAAPAETSDASRDEGNEKLYAHAEEKEMRSFLDPTYIRQLRRTWIVRLVFPYIRRFPVNTDENKFIFANFGIKLYNLNIFVDTN
jgi:hypothetical protein